MRATVMVTMIGTMRGRSRDARGTSLLDVVFALAVIGIVGGVAVPRVHHAVANARESGAARTLAVRIRQVRAEAVRQSNTVGLQFITSGDATRFRAYADGNGNGLRTRDITGGIDPPLAPVESLSDATGAVRFALDPSLPEVADAGDADDSSGPDGGASSESDGEGGARGDPIRLGASGLLSFSATGSGTSGTIYVCGPTRQFAVRIYGPTGRVRLLEFRRESRAWVER